MVAGVGYVDVEGEAFDLVEAGHLHVLERLAVDADAAGVTPTGAVAEDELFGGVGDVALDREVGLVDDREAAEGVEDLRDFRGGAAAGEPVPALAGGFGVEWG